MSDSIAIVGMGCRYPDARSPEELWENALAGRRAFRRIPPERLRLDDYLCEDRGAPDSIYSTEAALIEGYEFDRVGFRVAGSTYRSADLAHWLALDVAAQTLSDAGFEDGEGLPREMTGVFVGNTLTGEFSRANVLRLRWPYVRRVVEDSLKDEHWPAARMNAFIKRLEAAYKEPFPPIGDESLAGSLSNTIAGRICNYFDLKGGCQTVDAACASSLLAVANACSALVAGELDAALCGGVDLSLDPFELVGFAKVGALASELMRVYDVRSGGFWPGEGCGFALLMRHEDALLQRRRIYAVIRGWGVSSDGSGGITRPEVEGQVMALRRAYRRAGFGIETIGYFEGHGTGTSVGDAAELRALTLARRHAAGKMKPAAIGTIKANIGHTKAAAGIAGLLKAVMAVKAGILPPTTGCEEPHAELSAVEPAVLRTLTRGEPWPAEDRFMRAGVSAMGFGGINTHVVLEGLPLNPARALSHRERALLSSSQDAELFLLGAENGRELLRRVEHLLTFARRLSRAELSDLASHLARTLHDCRSRAAIVASCPADLAARLEIIKSALERGEPAKIEPQSGVFLGSGTSRPRIGYLFPGQGSPANEHGGSWSARFEAVREFYANARLEAAGDMAATSVAQPAIVAASAAALRLLERMDIVAEIAIGHSLGELTALHWAGAFEALALLRIARARGRAMMDAGLPGGAMISVAAGREEAAMLLNGDPVVIAGLNSPAQTVLSGEASAIAAVAERARALRLPAARLPVSHAFHSPLVAMAAPILAEHLRQETVCPLSRRVISTVTGEPLSTTVDLRELLCHQITSPVLFMAAATAAGTEDIDLWLEVGPGQVLRGVMSEMTGAPVISLDAGGPSLKGLLSAAGAAFALGQPVNHSVLFDGRFTRPFNTDWHPKFFVNPCELAPVPEDKAHARDTSPAAPRKETAALHEEPAATSPCVTPAESVEGLVACLVAERAELPSSAVTSDRRLLSDLHLNSITVSQIVVQAARALGLPPPVSATDFADATVAEVARALERQLEAGHAASGIDEDASPPGIDSWVRPFTIELVERPLDRRQPSAVASAGEWQLFAPDDYPLEDALRKALNRRAASGGVAVCLPPEPDERHLSLLLKGARAVLEEKGTRFVLVQHGRGAAAFARTLHLEAQGLTTCLVNVPLDAPQAVEWIVDEAAAAEGHVEAHYDSAGRRLEPVARALALEEKLSEPALDSTDVLIVTGGGKGITAECALTVALETGARLALMGTAKPEEDAELAANLRRMSAAGLSFKYFSVDVTDEGAVRAAVCEVEAALGTVTGIIHGAARNEPRLLSNLDEESFRRTLAVKVQGARNLLAAVNPDRLRLLVTFGSIIARTGLPGEADYGLANEWLTHLTQEWQAHHPGCRCLALEWSIWSGVGMGSRLGRIDLLVRQGITPVAPAEGVSMLRLLLGHSLPAVPLVIMGRFREMPTFRIEQPELPLLRFLEQPRVYYPNIELVADTELSTGTDPYLDDHRVQGERLLPGVMGIEAMVQVACALAGSAELPVLRDVKFNRPLVVPESGSLKIRIAALVREQGLIEVALRSEETAFQLDHFRATCSFEGGVLEDASRPAHYLEIGASERRLSINPERDLYGSILFHGGRFRRVSGYRRLRATECLAEIAPDGTTRWFSQYLPGKLVLGDPGARDAAIHAVQACIPHATLLPVGADRVFLNPARDDAPLFVHAQERARDGNTFTYDLELMEAGGRVRERWEGLRLRAVSRLTNQGHWTLPLLCTYVERRVEELLPGSFVRIEMEEGAGLERRAHSDHLIQAALGESLSVFRRPDGGPEIKGERAVSVAHSGEMTLAVAALGGTVGCDMERVTERDACVWSDLLGEGRAALAEVIAAQACEDYSTSATRVWSACESLKKAGAAFDTPLLFAGSEPDGWVSLSAGRFRIATYAAQLRDHEGALVIALLL